MDQNKSEAGLLQKMAAATSLEEQQKYASELEDLRQARRRHAQAEADSMWADKHLETYAPEGSVLANRSPLSHGTDWLADIDVPEHSVTEVETRMRAEASAWWSRVPDFVKEDPHEVGVQATGLARRTASQYGTAAEKGVIAFYEQIRHLAEVGNHPKPHVPGENVGKDTETSASDTPSLAEGTEPEGDGTADAPVGASEVQNLDAATWPAQTEQEWKDGQEYPGRKTASGNKRTSSQPSGVSDHDAAPEWETATAHDMCETCGWPVSKKGDGWVHDAKNPQEWTDKRKSASRKQAAVGDPCWSCGGKGWYSTISYDYDPYEGQRMEITCSTCGGSGVVNEPTDYPLADDPIFTDRYSSRKTAALSEADKAKVIPPMGYEVTREDVEAAMALPSGSRPRIYAYWDNGTGSPQVVKITSQHYLDKYGPDVEFYWGTNATMDNIGDWMVSRASRRTAAPKDGQRSYCRICGVEMEGQDYAWYALKSSAPKRDVGQHHHLPARNADWPGEFNAQGDLVPGTPGGGGGQYDAPAGTIYDAGGNPIKVSASRKTASVHTLKEGDKIIVTREDGNDLEMTVMDITPPGSGGRAYYHGPAVRACVNGYNSYCVTFDDSVTHLTWRKAGSSAEATRKDRSKTSSSINVIDLEVCGDCLVAAANGYDPHEWGRTANPEPWAEWDGYPGHPVAGDGEGHFSGQMCEGCGSRLAGDRYQAHWLEPKTATRKTSSLKALAAKVQVGAQDAPALKAMASLKSVDDNVQGLTGRQIIAHVLATGQMDESTRKALTRISTREKTERQSSRPLHVIAQAVRDDWGNVSPAAVPHLDALSVLESADDTYGTDSARTIVSRFLANSTDWRGKTAHQIKGELKAL